MDVQIVNYIEINGENVRIDTLEAEEKQRIAEMLQERFMSLAGFKRKTA